MKKIIAIVAVIATITACFCIGASAFEVGETLAEGTVITFKDDLSGMINPATTTVFFNGITNDGAEYTNVIWDSHGLKFNPRGNSPEYIYNSGWTDNKYKTVTLTAEWTITNSATAVALDRTVQSAVKPPMKSTLDNVNATFATTLTVATAIIAWLMANQIALVGLYLYILIALVATGKRFITGV